MGLPEHPAIPFPGTYPTEMHTWVYQETWTKMFTAKNVMAEHWRRLKVPPVPEQTGKWWHRNTTAFYTAMKINEHSLTV